MAFILPDLSYDYNALEPHIDARTMEIHQSRHHAGYTTNLNNAIEGTDKDGKSIEDILSNIMQTESAVRNNSGGFYNHNLYWEIMGPNGGGEPTGDLLTAINGAFGSFARFKSEFGTAGATRFGSGWAWLVRKDDGSLAVTSTPNQDNPLMPFAEVKGTPILGMDVWEHAYYLKYQNRRPEYIEAFFNVINWDAVAAKLKA